MGRTALTAASFCVFLTLGATFETAAFLAAALRATGFGAAFLWLSQPSSAFAAVFFAARSFNCLASRLALR